MTAETNKAGMPVSSQVLRRLGKLGEGLGVLAAAASRCLTQGVNEADPGTGWMNRERLQDEIADVLAQCYCTVRSLHLDGKRVVKLAREMQAKIVAWEGLYLDVGDRPLEIPENTEAIGRIMLESSCGLHGAAAETVANEWASMAREVERLRPLVAELEEYRRGERLPTGAGAPGSWKLADYQAELDGNYRDIDHKDHGGVLRVVWRMEGDERSPECEKLAFAVVAALNGALPQPVAANPAPASGQEDSCLLHKATESVDDSRKEEAVTVASRIQELTDEYGSVKEVARRIGVSSIYLQRLTKDSKVSPPDEVVAKLGLQRISFYVRKK